MLFQSESFQNVLNNTGTESRTLNAASGGTFIPSATVCFCKRLRSPPRLWLTQTAQCHWFLLLGRLLIIAHLECNISAEESKIELSHAALTDWLPQAPDDSFKAARSLLARLAVTLADVRAWFQLMGRVEDKGRRLTSVFIALMMRNVRVQKLKCHEHLLRATDTVMHCCYFHIQCGFFSVHNSNIFDPGLSKCPWQITHIYGSAIYVIFKRIFPSRVTEGFT